MLELDEDEALVLFCHGCNGHEFIIHKSGRVQCANADCGIQMLDVQASTFTFEGENELSNQNNGTIN